MHKFWICALLTVMPVTGIRVICVEVPAPAPAHAAPADPAVDAAEPRHHCAGGGSRVDSPDAGGAQCLFVPQHASVLLLVVEPLAVPPAPATIDRHLVPVGPVTEVPTFYLAPSPSPQTPPPKA